MEYTKFEKARMIGARALQIGMGAPFLINLTKQDLRKINYNPIEIAKMEFEQGIIPISIKRTLPVPDSEEYAALNKKTTIPKNTNIAVENSAEQKV